MKRLSHDLAGGSQRINKLSDQLDHEIRTVSEVWHDDVGRSFLQQHLSDVSPQLRLLVAELTTALETYESIARQLQDPD